jgi:hypothetical protein
MSLFRILGTAALICGVILFVFGIRATDKVHEKVVENVTGHYSDHTMGYIIGGVILVVVGAGLMMKRRRT